MFWCFEDLWRVLNLKQDNQQKKTRKTIVIINKPKWPELGEKRTEEAKEEEKDGENKI